ncbi:CPBP family intramembrane glutamic endopeptidase [Methyloglobulus sp.]|uniref:CPBP family intramembrane glutamic endopeptidase n=1 Tax=Methyloglobulus sp. TaxID=2518622 RepID=UPI0032B7B217
MIQKPYNGQTPSSIVFLWNSSNVRTNNEKIILFAAILEISYLSLSFLLAQLYGQWSYEGEIIRTGLRIIPIAFYLYFCRRYFVNTHHSFETRKLLTPQFIAPTLLLLLFAAVYTNAENETPLWQLVFAISGITAGFREELFYRGIVQNTLQIKYDYKIALLATTLLFTLSHIQYIYYGQIRGLVLITFAGIIFGSIFIYTGSVIFTACIHALYDVVLSIYIIPFRLSNGIQLPILFLIMLAFLIILTRKLYAPQQTDKNGNTDPDNLSVG